MSDKELKKFQEELLKAQKKLERSPKARKEFLVGAGVMTKKGNFRKAFKALG